MKKKQFILLTANSLIKVGDVKEYKITEDPQTKKPKKTAVLYMYRDFEYDIDGWADSKKYLPEDFDLVYMRLKREKTIPGWINGLGWCGWRLKPNDEVIYWKRKFEEEIA